MIPVHGVAILNGPDHLPELLASTDVPVEYRLVVDNGDVIADDFLNEATIIKPRVNLGVAAS
jgi:hypothetical protein